MATRMFALINGLIYTLIGILACLPQFRWRPERAQLRMQDAHWAGGFFGGFVECNLPHNILWIVIGVGGLIASVTFATSKMYGQAVFAVMTLFVFWGLLPIGIGDLWGFLPLSGWNIPIHFVTAVLAWYYGAVYAREAELRIA
ncbi:MAG TPA: DUF4383 domain-containing protein [Tepidisphaeraceae bacterium]